MNCPECQRIIDDVGDMDRLPPEAARHAAACAACERFGRDLVRLRALLREPARVAAPADFDVALSRRLRAARAAKPARAAWIWGILPEHGLAAAAAVVVLLGAAVAVDRFGVEPPLEPSDVATNRPLPSPPVEVAAEPPVVPSPNTEPDDLTLSRPGNVRVAHRATPRVARRAVEPAPAAETMIFVSDSRGARVVSVPQVLVGSAPVVPASEPVDPAALAVGTMSF